jgi:hypothetical protein
MIACRKTFRRRLCRPLCVVKIELASLRKFPELNVNISVG